MQNIFSVSEFQFPYDYKFPGQATSERILYVTRENKSMLWLRRVSVFSASLMVLIAGVWMISLMVQISGQKWLYSFEILVFLAALVFLVIGWWWVSALWSKSLAIVTTQRLVKFIYTTPVNRHILSLPLEMIVDTGSYTKGFFQAWLNLGTFTARSSASSSGVATDSTDRINKKYFYIENIGAAEDLQHYVNKLLAAFRDKTKDLLTFRPFIPHLKGEKREQFIRDNFPDYWS